MDRSWERLVRPFLFALFKRYDKLCVRLGLRNFSLTRTFIINFNQRIFLCLKPETAEVLGHTMFLDSLDSLKLSVHGRYEPFETELITRNVEKGDTVLDIGANIGYYTLILARLVGKNGKVFAFEPEPTNFSLLKKNVEFNGYQNVSLVLKAASHQNGAAKIYLSEVNKADHRIYDAHDGRSSVDIEMIRLDDYFKDYPKDIHFIKMDVQGAEMMVLEGMAALLKKNKDIKILTEFQSSGLKGNHTDPLQYLKKLKELGFSLFVLNEHAKKLEKVSSLENLLENMSGRNLFCVKETAGLNET